MTQQRIVDLQKTLMFEMAVGIAGIGAQELLLWTEIKTALVQQLRDHRGAATVHADDANHIARGIIQR